MADKGLIRKVRGKGYFVKDKDNIQHIRKGMVGLLLRPFTPFTPVDTYYNEIMCSIRNECMSEYLNLFEPHESSALKMTGSGPDYDALFTKAVKIMTGKVDGLFVDERVPDTVLKQIIKSGIPAVLVNRNTELTGIDTVLPANREGAWAGAEYAVRLGYKQFIVATTEDSSGNLESRCRGYQEKLRDLGILEECIEIETGLGTRPEKEIIDMILSRAHLAIQTKSKTAFLSCSDGFARFCVDTLHAHGIQRDNGVGVLGFGGLGAAVLHHPHLTTMRINTDLLGREAVRILITRMCGDTRSPHTARHIPVDMQWGETL